MREFFFQCYSLVKRATEKQIDFGKWLAVFLIYLMVSNIYISIGMKSRVYECMCVSVFVCNLCVPSEEQWLTLSSTSWWISLGASCVPSRQRQEDVSRYRDGIPPLVLCLSVSVCTVWSTEFKNESMVFQKPETLLPLVFWGALNWVKWHWD